MRSRQIGSTCSTGTNWEISIERESSRRLERLELGVLDDDELTLRCLPALDDLVGCQLAVVLGAPALLLDRRQALAVEQPERNVRLARGGLRRRREADGDADEPEGQGSVPGRTHELLGRFGDDLILPGIRRSCTGTDRFATMAAGTARSHGSGATPSREAVLRRRVSRRSTATTGTTSRGPRPPSASRTWPTASSRAASARARRSPTSPARRGMVAVRLRARSGRRGRRPRLCEQLTPRTRPTSSTTRSRSGCSAGTPKQAA